MSKECNLHMFGPKKEKKKKTIDTILGDEEFVKLIERFASLDAQRKSVRL